MKDEKINFTDILNYIKEILVTERIKKNISQKRLSEMMIPPTTQQVISVYERTGYRHVDIDKILHIARIIEQYPPYKKITISREIINSEIADREERIYRGLNSQGRSI